MLKKIFFLGVLVSLSFAQFKSIDANTMQQMIKKGVKVIDIRREEEFKALGIIKTAYRLTFFDAQGKYNIQNWMAKFTQIVKTKEQPFIIYCAHANRSKVVGKFLSDQLGYKNVYELDGGIVYGWIDKKLPTVPAK